MEEYKALVDKHNIDFAQYPMYVPDGGGGSGPLFKTDR